MDKNPGRHVGVYSRKLAKDGVGERVAEEWESSMAITIDRRKENRIGKNKGRLERRVIPVKNEFWALLFLLLVSFLCLMIEKY